MAFFCLGRFVRDARSLWRDLRVVWHIRLPQHLPRQVVDALTVCDFDDEVD